MRNKPGTRNWLVLTDGLIAFNAANRAGVLAEVDACVPAPTPFKCYGQRDPLMM